MARTLGRLFDVALLVAAMLVAWRFLDARGVERPPVRARLLQPNATLRIADVSWSGASPNVLLLAASGCEACRASHDFYKELSTRIAALPRARLVVISAEPIAQMSTWLTEAGVRPHIILQPKGLADLGFSVQPTLLLLDEAGRVTDILEKRLSAAEEAELWARLAGDTRSLDNTDHLEEIDGSAMKQLRATENPLILNVQPRADFERGHMTGAINIPSDELLQRGLVELSPNKSVIIDCSMGDAQPCRQAGEALRSQGRQRVKIFLP